MNKVLLALNVALLVAVAVLFFLFFSRKDNNESSAGRFSDLSDTASAWKHTPVAYFDMDSIEANFTRFKEMQSEVVKREARINDTINRMKQSFQNYYTRLQEQSGKLTPYQRDSIGNELAKMDMDIKNRASELNQNYQAFYMSKQQEIVNLIKAYCKEFNKEHKYSYIIANEPGLFYFKDTAYNITPELLKGLNEFYSKKK